MLSVEFPRPGEEIVGQCCSHTGRGPRFRSCSRSWRANGVDLTQHRWSSLPEASQLPSGATASALTSWSLAIRVARFYRSAFSVARSRPVAVSQMPDFFPRHRQRPTNCPWRTGQLAKAIHVLRVREA